MKRRNTDRAPFHTPILLIIFNRPDLTRQLISILRSLKPRHIYVTADGPREGKPGEKALCLETRRVLGEIDWPCKIKTRLLNRNLGCKAGVVSGIDWFFRHVSEGIILEDDIHPSIDFFYFCAELLKKYRDHARIGMISGCNFSSKDISGGSSYSFMQYFHIWGWATWKRAWSGYDMDMRYWPEVRDSKLYRNFFPTESEANYWAQCWEHTYQGKIDTWDFQWSLANYLHDRVSIAPSRNLITNHGFRGDATHTTGGASPLPPVLDEFAFPIKHPRFLFCNRQLESLSRATFGNFDAEVGIVRYYYKLRRWAGRLKRRLLRQ